MKRIRLELARDHEFPEGSRDRGYEFAAPLDEKGHLLADEWRTMRERCRVKRFWSGQKDELGHLVHRRGMTTSPASNSIAITSFPESMFPSRNMTASCGPSGSFGSGTFDLHQGLYQLGA